MKASTSRLGRVAALFSAAALSTVGLVGIAAPAQAAPLGTLTLNPASGSTAAAPAFASVTTSAACPSGYGQNVGLRVGTAGSTTGGLLGAALGAGGYDTAPVTFSGGQISRSLAQGLAVPTVANGDYDVYVECFGVSTGKHPDRFQTTITVNNGNWQVKGAVQPAAPTTTTLAVDPAGPVEQGTDVTLTATVAPTAAAGSVEFRRGAVAVGTAPVVNGTASITVNTLVAGFNSLTAVFTPAVAADFQPSTSAAVNVQVTVPGGLGAEQEITADVAPGAFSLAVAGGAVALTGGLVGGTATGALNKATVTDLRGTNSGWNLTGQVENFTGPAGATIPANQLGWTPNATKVGQGSGSVAAGAAANPGAGLGDARTLCSAAQGGSAGVFECGAGLTLGIPDTAVPGSYSATLTLTLV
ncbi:Ig-like domain repeat protein [Micromonospora sp. NPDC050417]|uniref:Ig-like domain repeat protein n=1 Tax=Micromonospora sp. NPDC050417 TaxID=3364280 RepID=UPI0037BBB23B